MMHMQQMNGLAGFGDIVSALEQIPGVSQGVTSLETSAQTTIQGIVTPYLVVAILLGASGFIFGLSAFIKVRKLEGAR